MGSIVPLFTPPIEEEEYEQMLRFEIEAYHALVSDSGRPLFPLKLLMEVSENVDKYRETMSLKTWRHIHYYPVKEKEEAKWDWMVFAG